LKTIKVVEHVIFDSKGSYSQTDAKTDRSIRNMVANFERASGQLHEKLPVI
jgi:hypothetical protein